MKEMGSFTPNRSSTLWEWADFYSRAWDAAVIPLREGKIPATPWLKYQKEKPTRKELKEWFIDGRPWGMALVCGAASGGLVRLDFDDPDEYERLKGAMPEGAPAFKSQREGGGYGVMLRSTGPVPKLPEGSFEDYPKLGVNGEGSITAVPPTPGYEWLTQFESIPTLNVITWLEDAVGIMARERPKSIGPAGDERLRDLLENTAEGGRSNALVEITNVLRSRGIGLDGVKEVVRPHLEKWPYTNEPMNWEEAEKIIEGAFERYKHQGLRYEIKPEVPVGEFRHKSRKWSGVAQAEIGSYLINRLIAGGEQANAVIAAYTKMGKSTLVLGVCITASQGRPIWGMLEVPKPLRIAYVDEERNEPELKIIIDKALPVLGEPKELYFLAGETHPYSIKNPASLNALLASLKDIGPDLIVIDGWHWFVGGSESDPETIDAACAWLGMIRSTLGCGTIVIHHTKKTGDPRYRPVNPLEMSRGSQLLMDQARTALIYEHVSGYEDYGRLRGNTNRADWNPVNFVLDYDNETQSHELVSREDGEELFDAETVKEIWGESRRARLGKAGLKRLKRLSGLAWDGVADLVGVNRKTIYRWLSGDSEMRGEKAELISRLVAEYECQRNDTGGVPQMSRSGASYSPTTPAEYGGMPKRRGPRIYKELNNMLSSASLAKPSLSETSPGQGSKPGALCAKCPLRSSPYVGGRGGGEGCVMIVGDGPGKTDAKSGKAYSGQNGKRLEKLLRNARIDPSLCRYTNVVRCHVAKTRKAPKKAIACCRPLLDSELGEFKPKLVITLGEVAFSGFYPGKLKSYHGVKIEGESYMLVPMYKLDAFDHTPDILAALDRDFRGLKKRPKMLRLSGSYSVVKSHSVSSKVCSLDTETTGISLRSKMLGLSVCENPGEAVYLCGENAVAFARSNGIETVVMQNAKYDLGILETNGVSMSLFPDADDTMLLAYVMERRPLGLKDLALQELNLEMTRFEDVARGKTLEGVPVEEVAKYCCSDADGTLRLWERLWKEASARERNLYCKFEKPLAPILSAMELRGISVDVGYLEELGASVDAEMDSIAAELKSGYGLERESLTSPKQMQEYIYRKLKLPISALTDPDSPSTGRRILERIRHEHPAVNLILRYRELSTLKNTFVTGIIDRSEGGLIYPEFNQAVVVTGRLSSSNPNFQGIPSRRTSEFRKAIVAPPGYVVAAFDNNQIDLRALAYISKCPVMAEVFAREDGDMHAETSMIIYGDVEGTHRFEAKAANFMPVYGGTYVGLARRTGLSEDAARKFLDDWYGHYYGVTRWLEFLRKQALSDGYVETIYGRRRHIPGLFTGKRSHALRQAQNTPIQGTSADVLKLQMIAVAKVAMPFAQIHDELDFYLPVKGLGERIAEIKAAMEGVDCPFGLKVKVKVGSNLGEMKEWEDVNA